MHVTLRVCFVVYECNVRMYVRCVCSHDILCYVCFCVMYVRYLCSYVMYVHMWCMYGMDGCCHVCLYMDAMIVYYVRMSVRCVCRSCVFVYVCVLCVYAMYERYVLYVGYIMI